MTPRLYLLIVITAGAAGWVIPPLADAASLAAETVAGWNAYICGAERRIAQELATAAVPEAAPEPAGRVRISKVAGPDPGADDRPVPGAMVHHWRGTVFIAGIGLDELLDRLANPSAADLAQEDVVAARVLERGPGWLRLYLRLQRKQVVTVVYDTEHAVSYTRHGERLASGRSIATRIAEVAAPGTAQESLRPPREDRGFLWRLNAYWRYEQRPGGVLVVCESISLSRAVPALVESALRPLIDGVARGSMERTLGTMRARYGRPPAGGE